MPGRHPPLIEAITALASGHAAFRLSMLADADIAWAIRNGLGPLLSRITSDDRERERSPSWSRVLSADLTARVTTGEQIDATIEILERCRGRWPITLLKGVAIGSEFYPEPHLRPMRDLDFLVPIHAVPEVQATLGDLGYERRQSAGGVLPADHHHGLPFWHPATGNWVEVHWGLVPTTSEVSSEPAFLPSTLASETRPLAFHGHQALSFSPELKLVHLALHWSRHSPLLGGLVALVDASLLLHRRSIDWLRIDAWLEGPVTATHLYLFLSYLERRGLASLPPLLLDSLRRRQRAFGRPNLALLHWLVDRHVVAGTPLRLPVTGPVFQTLWEELSRPASPGSNLLRLARFALPSRLRGHRP